MANFVAPATEIFQILQSYDYTVMLYGEDGNRVEDEGEARRMFARPENIMVSLIDDGDDSCIHLYIGNKTKIANILGLMDTLRTSASKYNLLFKVSQYGKQITPKDFAGKVSVGESRVVHEQASLIADRIMRAVTRKR